MSKLTRQGVRDLGNNTRMYRPATCMHFYAAELVVIERTGGFYWDDGEVYGRRCIHCGHARRV